MKHWYCLAIMLLGSAGMCTADDFGELPAGYTWHTDYAANTAIPVPPGWFIAQEQYGNSSVVVVSKQNVTAGEHIATGLSLQYIENFTATDGRGPYVYAQEFLGTITNESKILREVWTNWLAPGVAVTGIVTSGKSRHGALPQRPGSHHAIVFGVTHHLIISDEVNDTLRIITFQGPEAEWASAWQYGKVMLTQSVSIEDSLAFGTSALPPAN